MSLCHSIGSQRNLIASDELTDVCKSLEHVMFHVHDKYLVQIETEEAKYAFFWRPYFHRLRLLTEWH